MSNQICPTEIGKIEKFEYRAINKNLYLKGLKLSIYKDMLNIIGEQCPSHSPMKL